MGERLRVDVGEGANGQVGTIVERCRHRIVLRVIFGARRTCRRVAEGSGGRAERAGQDAGLSHERLAPETVVAVERRHVLIGLRGREGRRYHGHNRLSRRVKSDGGKIARRPVGLTGRVVVGGIVVSERVAHPRLPPQRVVAIPHGNVLVWVSGVEGSGG